MAGIEVAGLVLGAFPILVKCLEEYRRGFEPLEEWWLFRTRFIAFIDAIRHQEMLFHENMIRLLDPIITNNNDLHQLAANAADTRWDDGTLTQALQTRLATQLDRLMRTICRMRDIVDELKALLRIKDDKVVWLGADAENVSWQWHLQRLRLAFNKSKYEKVRKLGEHNKELAEILGFSENMLRTASRRGTACDSTHCLDRVRQNALSLFNALRQIWSCHVCQDHQANLKIRHDATAFDLEMLLVVRSEALGATPSPSRFHRVSVKREPDSTTATHTDISSVPDTSILSDMQNKTKHQLDYRAVRPSFQKRMSKKFKGTASLISTAMDVHGGSSSTPRGSTSASAGSSVMVIDVHDSLEPGPEGQAGPSTAMSPMRLSTLSTPVVAPYSIQSLCAFLGDSSVMKGTLSDQSDYLFEMSKTTIAEGSRCPIRLSLHEMLEEYQSQPPTIELSRQTRFRMAAHIASALLQTNQSPWLVDKWSKHSFYFLVDPATRKVETSHVFVSRSFPAQPADVETQESEEMAQQCLRGVGIMIMELIFGCNIERSTVFGPGCEDDAVDQVAYITAARQWQKRLEWESGGEVAKAVFRCLYEGGFGLAPCLTSSEFRKEVYQHLVEPLMNYRENWVLEPED